MTGGLFGRAREVAGVVELLERGTGALVVGDAGVGKSRFGLAVMSGLEAAGWFVVQARGTAAISEVPLGSFGTFFTTGSGMRFPSLPEARDALLADAGGRRVVLAVDDVNLLDEASLALLHLMVATRAATLLATIRTGQLLPAEVESFLFRGQMERVQLGPLDAAATAELSAAVLGRPLDAGTMDRIVAVSAGNPLYVRELLAASSEHGAITVVDGAAHIDHLPTGSQRLADVVAARVRSLTDAEREALELVAFGEPLGPAELGEGVLPTTLVALERAGLLIASTDQRRVVLRLGHPLYGEVLRASTPLLARRLVLSRLATALERTGTRRRQDVVKLARLAVDGGVPVAPEVLARAAAVARMSFDMVLAERLGRAGFDAAPSYVVGRQLALALYEMGDVEGLAELIPRWRAVAATRDEQAVVALVEAETTFWWSGRLTAAEDALRAALDELGPVAGPDDAAGEAASVLALLDAVHHHRLDEALRVGTGMTGRRPGGGVLRGALAAAQALNAKGRAADAIELLDAAMERHAAMGPGSVYVGEQVLRDVRQLALVDLGRFDEVLRLAELSRHGTPRANAVRLSATAAAYALTLMGRPLDAAERIVEARQRMFCDDHGPFGRWPLIVLAYAQAVAGRVEDTAATLAQLGSAAGEVVSIYEPLRFQAEVWHLWNSSDPEGARRTAAAGVEWARSLGDVRAELHLLHDLARLGRARDVAARVAELAAGCQGEWPAAVATHVAALAAGTADALGAAAEAFAALGALPFAAEAAAEAGDAAKREGDQRAGARWHHTAEQFGAQCQVGRGAIGADTVVVPLTRREREIAMLAADGLANKDIADRLFISVRTAESHLARVFEKLGVRNRAQLADVLQRS